jgi:hypothetical protein
MNIPKFHPADATMIKHQLVTGRGFARPSCGSSPWTHNMTTTASDGIQIVAGMRPPAL